MKKLFSLALVVFSVNVFSQSYLVLNNGVTLTLDKSGLIYDLGNFTLPYKVNVNGGKYLVEEEELHTIDSAGLLYKKDKKIDKVKGKGLNYLVNDDKLITIDSNGFFYEYDHESKSVFKKIITFGGTYFITKTDLYTVNEKGNYFRMDVPNLRLSAITKHGGNFFQKNDGVVYTISKDGFVYAKTDVKTGSIKHAGGNYFIDSHNALYTVSDEGFLLYPILPPNLKVTDIEKFGSNYMIDSNGKIFTVDFTGNVFERAVSHNLLNTKVFSL